MGREEREEVSREACCRKAVDLDVLKKYSSEANKDFEKFLSAAASNNQSGTLLHLTALVADLKILENEFNK